MLDNQEVKTPYSKFGFRSSQLHIRCVYYFLPAIFLRVISQLPSQDLPTWVLRDHVDENNSSRDSLVPREPFCGERDDVFG